MTGTVSPPRPPAGGGASAGWGRPPAPAPGRGRRLVAAWGEDRTLPATLALAGLTLAVALGFGRLFAGGGFLGPVLLTALGAHAVAWACRRRDWPLPAAGGLTALVALLVASWTLFGHTTAYGLPLPGTLGAALDALAGAREAFPVVKAPTDVLPGFVLATVLAVAVTAFMADWAAFRLQATFEALIPGFTIFVFTSALGTSRHRTWSVVLFVVAALAFLLAHGLGRSNRAGAWFGGRAADGPRRLVRTAAGLTAVALVLGLVVGPRLPGAGERPVVKYKNRGEGGSGDRATVSPLVDIRARLVERAGIEVFTVAAAIPSYWRLTSLDTFDGTIWSSNDTYRPTEGAIGTDEALRPDLPAARSDQAFAIRSLASIWLPAAFRPQRVQGIDGVSYNRDTASLITPEETNQGVVYTVRSAVPQLTDEILAGAPPEVPAEVAERYLARPDVSGRVAAEARRIAAAAGARTPYALAKALQDHFQSGDFRYDLEVTTGHDEDALEAFLLRTRRGYCEQFAGAYAVLGRLLGLPTRVAVGFTPGELQGDGRYHVRDEHAHAWPEVYLHGFGWVAFEPTPGRGAPGAEDYTGLPEAQDEAGESTTATTASPTASTVPTEEGPTTVPQAPEQPETVTAEAPAEDRGVPVLGVLAVAVLAVPLLWAVVVPALHLRRRRRRRGLRDGRARVLAAWDEVGEALSAAGVAARSSETMAEFAGRAGRSASLEREPARDLGRVATLAATASYRPGEVAEEVAEEAREAAARVRRAVEDGLTRRDRLRWWLDPRNLR